METTIKIQFYILTNAIYAGLIAGLIYDIYRVIRHKFKPRKIVASIEDLLFWVGIALIFFYIINKSDWSQLRGYIFIGFFLGGFMYLKILSSIIFPLLLKIFNGICFVVKWIVYIVKLPFKRAKTIISPRVKRINRVKRIPIEAYKEIKRYKKMISRKK